ncbi:MAG: hypothetical protein HYY84_03890 [Deltaproteobacteria bacterium]|nr:hypothetical protein [Deltaproteobacteria bacterium]
MTVMSFAVGLSLLWTGVGARADDWNGSGGAADGGAAPIEGETPTDTGEPALEPEEDEAFDVEQPTEPVTPSDEPAPKTFEKLPDAHPEAAPEPAADPDHPKTSPSVESQSQASTTAPQGPVTVQTFHTTLSPHGTWYDSPEHGWIWRPRVGYGWRPYSSHGRWIYTSHGWMWRSYHRWGWAPFHYGRWFVHPSLGWSWVPGTAWAPAWVSWRYTGNHVGWAPVPPGYTAYTSSTAYPIVHESHWVFVPGVQIISPRFHRHIVHHSHPTYTTIYRTSVYAPVYSRVGRVAHAGPRPVVLARTIGRVVRAIPVVASARPGARVTANAIPLYRPVVRAIAAQSRPVVGVRGAAFSGGKPAAVPIPTATVHRPHGVAVTPSFAKWRPAAVSPANVIRATYVQPRPSIIRPRALPLSTARPGVVGPTVVRPTLVRPGAVQPTVVRPRVVYPTTVRPRAVYPAAVRPYTVRPTVVRPNAVQPSTPVTTTFAPRPRIIRPTKPLTAVRPIQPTRAYQPFRPPVVNPPSGVQKPYKPTYVPTTSSSKPKKKSR